MAGPNTTDTTTEKAGFRSSYVILGLLMLLSLDAGLRLADSRFHFANPLESPNRSMIWWLVNGYANEKAAPDIALLGSSLMNTAHHAGDATKTNVEQNEVSHYRATCLEDFLAEKTGEKPSTFCLSIAGQMASDSYLITRSILAGDKRPKVIIYGIAPRDLIDSTLPSAASTETFKYLSRISDLSDVAVSARTSPNELIEFALEKTLFTLSHRPNLIALQHRLAYALTPYGKDAIAKNEINSLFKLRQMARLDQPDDNGANELRVSPYNPQKEPFRDNTAEYRQRYSKIKNKVYRNQLAYLEKLMKLTNEKGIKLIVVNMPLTPGNVSLMPPGFYDEYKKKIAQLSAQNSTTFIDMNRPGAFEQKHYADTVHLNGLGGVAFFQQLSEQLALDRSFSAAVSTTH